jgi:hypothetical protein
LVAAAVLHDVVEDTQVSIDRVAAEFGGRVAGFVAEVTDDKSLPKAERKRLQVEHAAAASVGAKTIKLADKTSNLRALAASPPVTWSPERRVDYVAWARQVASQCGGASPELEARFHGAAAVLESGTASWERPGPDCGGECWVEIYQGGAVGPDFGWPPEADRFTSLGPSPRPPLSWTELIYEWIESSVRRGDGVHGSWARAYLTAQELRQLLDTAFGTGDPRAEALKPRISDEHRYLVFARDDGWEQAKINGGNQ